MAEFCFFTDHNLLNVQTSNAFGPVSSNPNTQYRLQNLHTATAPAPAYAIVQGEVLVQEVAADPTLVNIVLRPNKQPDLDLPKIEYIVYKGILKSSLISGATIAPQSTNDLTESLWQAQLSRNLKVEEATGSNPGDTPNANCLGINYTATGTAPFLATNDTPLDNAFFNDSADFQLPTVQKGWEIGTFSATGFGILIAFERIAHPHTFGLARELDSVLSVSPLSGSPTQVETFEHNHEKEAVLSYLDDAAFFGSFFTSKLDIKTGGTLQEKEGDDIYDLLLSKYLNKNAVYVDIRNEFNTSFDYYLNYGRNIHASFAQGAATATLNYYRDNWPILKLDVTDFASGNGTDKNHINFSMPQGANDVALIYFSKAFKGKRKFRKLRYKKKFEQSGFTSGFSQDFELITPNKAGGTTTPIAAYYQLIYVKKQSAANVATDFSPECSHYLDFAFPILQNAIPFKAMSGVVKYKSYDSLMYIDSFEYNGTDYMANVCIAEDDFNITLLAPPRCYLNGKNVNTNPISALVGEVVQNNGHFLDHLSDRLRKSVFATVEVTIGGLADKLVVQEERFGEFSNSIFNSYDPEYLSIIIEKGTFNGFTAQIVASSIELKYGVWLFVDSLLHTYDGTGLPVTEITLGLSGLEHSGGSILRKNLTTTVKVYANEHI